MTFRRFSCVSDDDRQNAHIHTGWCRIPWIGERKSSYILEFLREATHLSLEALVIRVTSYWGPRIFWMLNALKHISLLFRGGISKNTKGSKFTSRRINKSVMPVPHIVILKKIYLFQRNIILVGKRVRTHAADSLFITMGCWSLNYFKFNFIRGLSH